MTEPQRGVPLGRAGVAGAVIAAGIGFGAFNPWWVSAFIGVPLVITGLVIAPRPSRVSELTVFGSGATDRSARARIDALTRSSLADEDRQPTLVTATISPADDTAYQARWMTSMSRKDFQSLTTHPHTSLPADRLPPREAGRMPEFGDQPGKWAVIYPAVTIATALAVLFGVGEAWHVSISMPSLPAAHRALDFATQNADLDARRDTMIRAVTEKLGAGASDNLLDLRFTGSGSDYGTVLNPTNGESTTVYISTSRDVYTTPTPSTLRKTSTFTARDVASIKLTEIAGRMGQQFRSAGNDYSLETLQIKRSGPGKPIVLTGTFNGPSTFPFGKTISALPDGTIAELFDPADFAVSLQRAREALQLAGIGPSDRVLTAVQIRGTARNTPNLHASSIQNSGGVLIEFQTGDRRGDAVVVPGQLPEITERSYSSGVSGFSFDDISLPVLESVRAQAMQRGSLEPYESQAVDIEISDAHTDNFGLTIRIQLARVDAAAGTYSLTGEFLKQGTY